jgi:hypothetical protein
VIKKIRARPTAASGPRGRRLLTAAIAALAIAASAALAQAASPGGSPRSGKAAIPRTTYHLEGESRHNPDHPVSLTVTGRLDVIKHPHHRFSLKWRDLQVTDFTARSVKCTGGGTIYTNDFHLPVPGTKTLSYPVNRHGRFVAKYSGYRDVRPKDSIASPFAKDAIKFDIVVKGSISTPVAFGHTMTAEGRLSESISTPPVTLCSTGPYPWDAATKKIQG